MRTIIKTIRRRLAKCLFWLAYNIFLFSRWLALKASNLAS